jgi:ubiquinone/menaquinone biosynthesis C-methylase UbiE
LLPLPDRSVSAVYLDQILSEFWLPEERERLLAEARRILIPEGKLLVAERIRARDDLLLTRLITYSLPTNSQWRTALERSGFVIRRETCPRGLLYCVRAEKPSPARGRQLSLKLEYV